MSLINIVSEDKMHKADPSRQLFIMCVLAVVTAQEHDLGFDSGSWPKVPVRQSWTDS